MLISNPSPNLTFADEHQTVLGAVEQLMIQLVESQCPKDILSEICRYHLNSGGRRLRARLALSATAALGESPILAIGWAAACELLHNATLIHDDLQDGDRMRRGRATVWSRYGLQQAINAGDLLLMLPTLALESSPLSSSMKWELSASLARAASAVVRGQSEELLLNARLLSTDLQKQYERVVIAKTSALFVLPVVGAARIAKRAASEVDEIQDLVARLGMVFQICDDLIDILGRKGRDHAGEDLREGKVSSLVVTYLEIGRKRNELIHFLQRPRLQVQTDEILSWTEEFRDSGAIDQTRDWVYQLALQIKRGLDGAGLPDLTFVIGELLDTVVAQVRPRSVE